jgi:imidazolonepropionase-like amidohydrolase
MIRLFKNNPKSLMGYSALVPTLSVIINVTDHDTRCTRFTPVQYENGVIIRKRMINAFRKGLEGGIRIGVGNDAGVVLTPHYDVWRELVHFVEYGNMTPRQAICHATKGNAEILGIEEETGTIETGKSADFVVLDGDPTENLYLLSKPSMVVVFGQVIEKPAVKRIKAIDAISQGTASVSSS